MKVKIFTSYYSKDLEETINEFIKDKKVIDIKYVNDIYTALETDRITSDYNVMIMYEEYDRIDLLNCLQEFQNHTLFTSRQYREHLISEKEFTQECSDKLDATYKRVAYLLKEKE